MSDCVFCDIAAGEAEATVVYQDEVVTAFMDIKPINAGHVDVIPNTHAAGLADLDAETGAHMFRVAQKLAAALRASDLECEGVNLFLADGAAAMQEVFHVHLHAGLAPWVLVARASKLHALLPTISLRQADARRSGSTSSSSFFCAGRLHSRLPAV